jgi:hypothetical protein
MERVTIPSVQNYLSSASDSISILKSEPGVSASVRDVVV